MGTSAYLVASLHHCAEYVLNPQFSMGSSCSTTSLFIPENVLKQKYLEDCLSTREIAKKFSCSKTRVRNLLLKYKVPLRESPTYYRDNSRIFGKRKVASKVIDHKGELHNMQTGTEQKSVARGLLPAAVAGVTD